VRCRALADDQAVENSVGSASLSRGALCSIARSQRQVQAAEDKAKAATETARKASAKASFYLFFSMLIGAFIASAAGALGGRPRDEI
jgi:hypothetical protein